MLLFEPPFDTVGTLARLHQGLPSGGAGERRPVHPRRPLDGHGHGPQRGRRARGLKLLRLLNPIEHARDPEAVWRYGIEPYVVAADVYRLPGRIGQGGWSWYTGSAAWMYRAWVEEVLGLTGARGRAAGESGHPRRGGRVSACAIATVKRSTRSRWRIRTAASTVSPGWRWMASA